MPTITVHHLEGSRSHRVLWFLEELEIPYDLKRYARDPETIRAPPALRAIHPLGKSPVVEIDGRKYAESGAILEHLTDLSGGRMRPAPGTEELDRYRFFLHYAEGSLMPPLLVALITQRLRTKVPWPVRPIARGIADRIDGAFTTGEIAVNTAFLEEELRDRTFLAGDALTAADIQMSFPIEALLSRGNVDAPRVRAYLERLRARPAYARALERGGPMLP